MGFLSPNPQTPSESGCLQDRIYVGAHVSRDSQVILTRDPPDPPGINSQKNQRPRDCSFLERQLVFDSRGSGGWGRFSRLVSGFCFQGFWDLGPSFSMQRWDLIPGGPGAGVVFPGKGVNDKGSDWCMGG